MRVDHVSYAAEHDGLQATAERLAKLIGVDPVDGGHPPAVRHAQRDPAAGARAIRRGRRGARPPRFRQGAVRPGRPGPLRGRRRLARLVHRASTTSRPLETRIGREAVPGNRHRPDGVELRWRQLGVKGLMSDPQLPYFVQWEDASLHPSTAAMTTVTIDSLQIAGDPARVRDWLGLPPDETSSVIDFTFVAPRGTPGLLAVTFDTPDGQGHRLTLRSPTYAPPDLGRSRGVVVCGPSRGPAGPTRCRARPRSGGPPAASRNPPRACPPTSWRPRRPRRPRPRTRRGTPWSPRTVRR